MLQEAYLMNVEGSASDGPNPGDTGWATRPWTETPAYLLTTDLLVVLTAAALPWSTTATAVLMVGWLILVIPSVDWDELIRGLALPACVLPLALFALADLGVLWSDAPWEAGLQAINPVSKLLLIPFLFHHFKRSERASWVFASFVASSMAAMMLPWFAANVSTGSGVWTDHELGWRSQCLLCASALMTAALAWLQRGQVRSAAGLAALSLMFFVHELIVRPGPTACMSLSVLLLALILRRFRRRIAVVLLAAVAATGGVAWAAAPLLSRPIGAIVAYHHPSASPGFGPAERLAELRRSLASLGEAPLFGHGTGVMRPSGSAAAAPAAPLGAVRDPQSQSLSVAWQWGLAGLIVLYAMWSSHIGLFSTACWTDGIGLMVVLQTFLCSLVSSQGFDVNEGWVYVIGVGVAGGVALRRGGAPPEGLRPGLSRNTDDHRDGVVGFI
ncbi:O-antigen ligase domain-containing protein [Bradyrhizobium sp. HKCCYLS20291]|uniref:O-antigen ligase domain-containing protein n=1 Tax=Bradyrhizobium sp. HKCCYLS20291 TaxID=3420766 RepID=UPI003EB8438C